jgi:hypothetical protein
VTESCGWLGRSAVLRIREIHYPVECVDHHAGSKENHRTFFFKSSQPDLNRIGFSSSAAKTSA